MLVVKKFDIQNMKMVLILFLIASACGQSGVAVPLLNNVTLNIFPSANLSLYQDPNSFYYPVDFYFNIEPTDANIYTLGSNRIIQVYTKATLSSPLQTVTNYSYSSGSPFSPVNLGVNQQENLLSLASYSSGILKYLIFAVDQSGFQSYLGVCGDRSFPTSPAKVFMRGSIVYSYFKMPFGNDSVYITDTATNVSQLVTFPFVSCSIVVSPDKNTALVWDSSSKVYIFAVATNFTLLYTYTGSIALSQYTQTISFSSDSRYAIIETDNLNPIRVLNVNDFTVLVSIPGTADIRAAIFLDPTNRFILIETSTGNQIYDMQVGSLQNIAGSFPSLTLQGNSKSGLMYSVGSNYVSCYGVNITDQGSIVSSYPQTLSNTSTTNATNTTNTTDTTNSTSNGNLQIDPSAFYLAVNYTDSQNHVLSILVKALEPLNQVIQKIFAIIFSSPLTAYFLSLFNYFTLCSYYVLVNIKIPEVVFYYLSRFYESCTGNIISEFGLLQEISPFSAEQVTDARPLYFNVSSDLASANYTSFIVLVVNVVLNELLILLTRKGPRILSKAHKTLVSLRIQTYWGLVVSNVVPIILPWKYMVFGKVRIFSNKFNLAAEYLLLGILYFMLIASLLDEFDRARRKKHPIKTALRQWWPSYQNYIYPLLLLVENPLYFMVGIGLSNLFALYNSFYVEEYRLLSIIKGFYPVLFQSCFVVFMLSENNLVLIMTTFFCLSVFLIGSMHYLLETAAAFLAFTYSFLKNTCRASNKISDSTQGHKANKKDGHCRSKQRHDKVWRGQPNKSGVSHSPKGIDIKQVISKINEQINNKPNVKVMNIKRYQDAGTKQRQKIRVSKDRRQGSQLIFLQPHPK